MSVADGGRIHIAFREPKAAGRGVAWGLRWQGDHVAALRALAAGEEPKLIWDDSALGARAAIFSAGGITYVGLKP